MQEREGLGLVGIDACQQVPHGDRNMFVQDKMHQDHYLYEQYRIPQLFVEPWEQAGMPGHKITTADIEREIHNLQRMAAEAMSLL